MKKLTAYDYTGKPYEVNAEGITWHTSAYGIIIRNGKILLSPQNNHGYVLPGGGVELDETLEEAVVREVKEETGLTVRVQKLVTAHDSLFYSVGKEETPHVYRSVLLYYLCEYVGGELSIDGLQGLEKEYVALAEWVDVHDIDELTCSTSVDWRPAVKEALRNR